MDKLKEKYLNLNINKIGLNDYVVKGSYKSDDCIFLLKDLKDSVKEVSLEEKEKLISEGVNYGKLLSKEYEPTEEDIEIFKESLELSSKDLAIYIKNISKKIYKEKGQDLVLVSLARAGTPFGILISRYLNYKYKIKIPHYSVSIIRELGIDENALIYILNTHTNCNIQFIDGWTGKGSIYSELRKSIDRFNIEYETKIDSSLAVVADAAGITPINGTSKDILVPNACLNSTVSGLVSRTIINDDVSDSDFHGTKMLNNKKQEDYSNMFVDEISKHFEEVKNLKHIRLGEEIKNYNIETLIRISLKFDPMLEDNTFSKIKLSIGETLRALLRRNPKVILVKNQNNPDLRYILKLAKQRDIEVVEMNLGNYECACIIK